MAERRMFSLRIINSARFLRMPVSSRLLYYDLGMHADDDGVVEAFSVMTMTGATEDDLRVLCSKGFVSILNEDLVTYINDWQENNKIRPDRKVDSIYKNLLVQLNVATLPARERADTGKPTGSHRDMKNPDGQPMDNQWTTVGRQMDRIGKDRIGKDSTSIEESNSLRSLSSSSPEVTENHSGETSEKSTDDPIFIELPIIGGKTAKIRQSFVDEMSELYPAVDIPQAIRNAKAWLVSNPKNVKSDWKRFLNNWFRRDQDKAPVAGGISKNIKRPADYTGHALDGYEVKNYDF